MVRIGEGDNHYYDDYNRDNPPAGSKKSGGSSGNIQDEYQKHLQETRSKYQEKKEDAIAKYNRMRNEAMSNYESFRNQTVTDYENFRQQVNEDYENFVQQVHEEYENFATPDNNEDVTSTSREEANKRYAEVIRQPWQEYEKQEPIPMPEIDDSGPIIYQNEQDDSQLVATKITDPPKLITGPPRGTDPEYDKMVQGETQVEETPAETPKPREKDNQPEVPKQVIQRDGITGSYSITPGKNGSGFMIVQEMNVSLIQNKEYNQYFKADLFGENKIEPNKQGYYEYRGVKSDNYNIFSSMLRMRGQQTIINNAIYNDLTSKQKSGAELTDAEKNFMQYHLQQLESMGLGLDSNGKIYDLSE